MPHGTDDVFNDRVTKTMAGTDPVLHPGLGIVVAERDKVVAPFDDWVLKFAAGGEHVRSTRTPVQSSQKIHSRIVLEPIFNHYVKVNVKYNSLIPDDSKIAWGIHIDSTVRHVIGEGPAEFPIVKKKDLNTPLHIKLEYKANTTPNSIALPADVDRCDAFVYLFTNPGTPPVPTPEPVAEGQFIKRAESSEDKIDIPFTLAEKGMRVKILLQYFNKKGHGVSSEILDTFVP